MNSITESMSAQDVPTFIEAIESPAFRAGKPTEPVVLRYDELKGRDHVRRGVKFQGRVLRGAKAEVVVGVSVRIFGTAYNLVTPLDYDKTFKVGDFAIYGAYNVAYTGTIVRIGPKTVTMKGHSSTNQLPLDEFTQLNYRFDLAKYLAR